MKDLFELKLNKDWVNEGSYDFEIQKKLRVSVEAFSKGFAYLHMTINTNDADKVYTLREDTEIHDVEGQFFETTTILTVEQLGDNLEHLFELIHEILKSLKVSKPTCETYKDEDFFNQ